ncbi:glycosyltransferase family 4 protein [Mucilaginibacter arboris]|uniref:Glycosyltransferase n=1 Tax=Mucilaginibacter arboris TaxID=2682090 RepID=A0A7K1SYX4_9SPHI|nr:glycosyltransferase family 4 protein [Mucilaginibacter arboris]MVN22240.1 glycosyltransferase [Mucilaginibacter arboris]
MKILIVSHGVINNDSGLGRVHYELIQEYKKAGHLVEKVDYSDLYPKGQNKFQRVFGSSFTEKLLNYLQKNAFKYNVIDANFENVAFPKESFGFKGVLFVRSHGIRPLYIVAAEKIERYAKVLEAEGKAKKSIKGIAGSYIRSLYKDLTLEDFEASLKYADVVHCLNTHEYEYFIKNGVEKNKLVFIPNGLPQHVLTGLYLDPSVRKKNNAIISFLGSWSFVKGIKDWRSISNFLIKNSELKEIHILGCVVSEDMVKSDFDDSVFNLLKITSTFKPNQLSYLLEKTKVGVFPSYMEGFGFAVLEQLAAGIPVVAYNIPGVADMLNQVDPTLLIEPGKIENLVEKVKYLLNLNEDAYERLSNKCIEVSKRYILENLAPVYLQTFENSLKTLNG